MALVSQNINSFKGGVSQQPDILKFPDQLVGQTNAFSNEAEGLQKRPPSVHIARLEPKVSDKTKVHFISRDENEKYCMLIQEDSNRVGSITVHNLIDGSNRKVTLTASGRAYISNIENPARDLVCVTVADYTFVLNKTVYTRMKDSSRSPNPYPASALMEVRQGGYAKKFGIWVNNVFAAGVRPPDGGAPNHSAWVGTSIIADSLLQCLQGRFDPHVTSYEQLTGFDGGRFVGAIGEGWDRDNHFFARYGDTLLISRIHGTIPMNISLRDDFGGLTFLLCAGEVSTATRLPLNAPDGYIVRIKGTSNSQSDDYWVRFDGTAKIWKETIAPALHYEIDPATMPHALRRQADGSFILEPIKWADRTTGDNESNPFPSFIDHTINDIFFFRNRLGFLSDENVILSKTSDFFNFWFNSAAAIQDTDPIDVSVSSNKVTILTHAIPFAQELALFSHEVQFMLRAEGVLSPKSVHVDQTTNFQYDTGCRPLNLGRSVYFAARKAEYSSLFRYYAVEDLADIKDAEDVTLHCPSYILNGAYSMTGNTADSVLLMLSEGDPTAVWVYKYILKDGQHLQQSWSKWHMGDKSKVISIQFVENEIYLVVARTEGIFLERMSIRGNNKDYSDEPVRIFLDRKTIVHSIPATVTVGGVASPAYNDYTDETRVSLSTIYRSPTPTKGEFMFVTPEGKILEELSTHPDADGLIRLRGNHVGKRAFVGISFNTTLEFATWMIKQPNQDGTVVAEAEGRLQLRYGWFNYADTGKFTVTVGGGQKPFAYTFTPRILGDSNNVLGKLPVHTGKFKFPIQAHNVDAKIVLTTEDILPLNLVSGGWEGLYTRRNRQI